ncbi:MAG: valine--tRNA ligase [Flavobacteriales bacterium]|nr:valine--tRNA ligase [Flavobacteriales bacterium]
MSEIAKTYDPTSAEEKWYKYWMEHGYFHSEPDDREPYTIVIPPPNVTGVLHMGHMLNNTIQDVLIRRARMQGKNACWVAGTDHASIATEAKVVKKLADEGIKKWDLTREQFLEHAWEWTHKHGGIILEQLKKLGASCDWERTRFTMEDDMSEAVIDVFIDLHAKGLVYKGHRMVNWDPKALTAVSDEEVYHKEVNSKLYHVRYQIEGTHEWVTIATTRPETILGDTAICINPEDERYFHLKGKRAIVPMANRSVPIIFDDYVDKEFGTGCLKVTPAHDINDYEIGLRHGLEIIDTLNADGTMSAAAGFYLGEDRFIVRKKIAKDLAASGHLVKEEDYVTKVGCSERTDAVIEPRLSEQWFVKMSELAKPALENVLNGNVQFHPNKFINTYKYWMENVRDWCISRQLWWGQQIPAWYAPDGEYVVAKTAEAALDQFKLKIDNCTLSIENLKQDEDVVDTWFSSWLWPISVFDGFKNPDGKDINYYYPTNDLVTAPEILFFWVARMVMAGYEYRGELPFRNVYLTGIVRDKQGRKMSKSLGNSPDPLDLIKQFGADGVRVGMLLSSPAGNDLLFDEGLCLQGRNFTNKVWNSFRLIQGWEVDNSLKQPEESRIAIEWFRSRFSVALAEMDDHYDRFRLSDALMSVYKLVWDDFCSWYLEIVKPAFEQPIDPKTLAETNAFLGDLLKLLHPFTPFIAEEIWDHLGERTVQDRIIIAPWPKAGKTDAALLEAFDRAMNVIMEVRKVRNEKQLGPKAPLQLLVKGKVDAMMDPVIAKLAFLEEIAATENAPANAASFVIKGAEFFIPLEGLIDPAEERAKLEKELEYTRGFLASVEKKLSNERFVSGAPAQVLQLEQSKKADAEGKIKALEEQLAALGIGHG